MTRYNAVSPLVARHRAGGLAHHRDVDAVVPRGPDKPTGAHLSYAALFQIAGAPCQFGRG